MNIETVRSYCLSKRGATEDSAFGPDMVLFRLCGKIFSCLDLHRPDRVVLKSTEDEAVELRARYQGVQPAWHWNKRYWNEVFFDEDVEEKKILELLDHSYDLIRMHLPQRTLYSFSKLPEGWKHEHFPVLDSAMNVIRQPEFASEQVPVALVTTDFQTAGRGQGTNTWESEKMQNLLFAFRFFPQKIKAVDQFGLLQCVSLAVVAALEKYYKGEVKIKWPNDIYCEDQKICGILIEHDLCGAYLTETRCGIGINVNQQKFLSSAPNPVSLWQLTGKQVDRSGVLRYFINAFSAELERLQGGGASEIAADYLSRLYRLSGWYPFRDVNGDFEGHLLGVAEDGRLRVVDRHGKTRIYAHKEVEFILTKKEYRPGEDEEKAWKEFCNE